MIFKQQISFLIFHFRRRLLPITTLLTEENLSKNQLYGFKKTLDHEEISKLLKSVQAQYCTKIAGLTKDECNKLPCETGHYGSKCQFCKIGYYKAGLQCQPCNCNPYGQSSISCNHLGICRCKTGYTGSKCDQCDDHYLGFPNCQRKINILFYL